MLQAVLDTPLARAITLLQSEGMNPADRAWAGDIITTAMDSCIRTICRSWGSNRTLMRSLDLNDVAQESRVLILTRVVRGFRIPEDAEDQDSISRALHRYTRRILNNHWIDTMRSITRDGTKRPLTGIGVGYKTAGESRGDDFQTPTVDGTRELDDAAAESELLGAMKGALTEENFNILYLRFQGFTTTEIGAIVGLTRKAVNERIRFRIKPVLAPRLRRQGFEVP